MSETIEIQTDSEKWTDDQKADFESLPESVKIMVRHVDTAWKVLRLGAARMILQEVREDLAEQGQEFIRTDDDLFAYGLAFENAPRGVGDLFLEDTDITAASCVTLATLVAAARDVVLLGNNENFKHSFGVDVIARLSREVPE